MTDTQILEQIKQIDEALEQLNQPGLHPSLNYAAGILAEDKWRLMGMLGAKSSSALQNAIAEPRKTVEAL